MFWILELFDAGLETTDGFTQELCARLTLAIVVLAQVLLLRTNALLTGWFGAVTALGGGGGGISTRASGTTDGGKSPFFSSWQGEMDHERGSVGKSGLYRPAAKTCLASLESGGSVAGCGRRIVVGHYRKD
jgi:hypothetical protein